ncbi:MULTISPECIES: sigma-54 dependent transcriptional regulator [Acidithiobacillus]|uniref:Sigma-54-dependent Fis family transcriptional regulator n=2 Tax=Acidithiobacillus TaxID=119977 RepID=A0A179BJT2_ACIFR|nr:MULTISPECIES: sigma-54 dependent transcriptional regulator [Acidithiobacillus]MDA8152205.1 sigma 54-interacting transcriptional regulator [Acidithiobacillus sp.]MBU2829564.1 sigma-54-dependent Fis family transcriptional regulator [Acidithiobacillus ferriphilus]MBU2853625.1 sigma-54-dependent Fis family transcriptional regulator [Acidithiobacillus ferriphilus]MDA8181515.1 sigma 54-interacting transcriptional regulator [Acidithiobacillus sp.]MEB8487824.1 sigma 54-interacting transcriptional r
MSYSQICGADAVVVSRPLLYFGTRHTIEPWAERLCSEEWQLRYAENINELQKLSSAAEFKVGIVAPDHREIINNCRCVESTIARAGHIRWIVLLPKDALDSPPLRELVSATFYDYHTLPVDSDRLLLTLGHALGMAEIAADALLPEEGEVRSNGESEMVGASPQMQKVFKEIRKVAGVDAPVLITGESGTGKELAAQAIHERSSRGHGPFIAVNCGALPTNLIQSELFGHEKGSFTGAHQRKIGRIEVASGGSLFLDEIGDLPMELQANLLRFLQEKTIERVGGREDITVDVRVIAATHVDLEKAVREGRFREDLYYRLNVLQIRMPALRERVGDVPLLAQYIFHRFAEEKGRKIKGFSKDALHTMNNFDWPGNVRELINRVRRAMVMCDNSLISPSDLGLEQRNNSRWVLTLGEARDRAETDTIRAALAQNQGSVLLASKQLGVSRVTLYRLMEKHALSTN